ncbi:MAG TPA: hypothetical protein ENI23_07105 [bacterium]|nr:hypothetical protein [bacterium]
MDKEKEKLFLSDEDASRQIFYQKILSENKKFKKDMDMLVKGMHKIIDKHKEMARDIYSLRSEMKLIKKNTIKQGRRIYELWCDVHPNKGIQQFIEKSDALVSDADEEGSESGGKNEIKN